MAGKIIIAGGTGLIGRHLTQLLITSGYSVTIVSRSSEKAKKEFPSSSKIDFLSWKETENSSKLTEKLEGSVSVINLSGASVGDKRWTDEYKKILYDSRIDTTRDIVKAISECKVPPKSFISSSAIGIYGFTGDEKLDESSGYGSDFLATLVVDWEKEAIKAEQYGVRTVLMRTGIVLDKDDGAFPQLYRPFKFFAGGYLASGKQWFSWIHIKDIIELYKLAIENDKLNGPINGTAHEAVTNKELCKTIAKVTGKPCWTKVPAFALRIMLGEFAESLINGQRVIPKKAEGIGFKFEYPSLEKALSNLFK